MELANAIAGGFGGTGEFAISSSLPLSRYCRILLKDVFFERWNAMLSSSLLSSRDFFDIRDFCFFLSSASVVHRSSLLTALLSFFLASS